MTAPRVLLVEDSPTQAAAVQALLVDAGYDVVVATSGEAGVAESAAGEFAVVISDIVMPGSVDGYEVCRRIKAGNRPETPVVLLTSLSDPLDIIRGLECGADNFFTKSVEPAYLLDRLKLLLSTKATRARAKIHMGVKVVFMDREFTVTSEREQILDLLISTFEDAVRQNHELRRREEDLARSHQALHGLYRIALGLNEATTETEVAEAVLDRALELPGVRAGWIALREGETGFRTAAARGLPPALAEPGALQGDCHCRRKLLAGELDSVANMLECERLKKTKGDTGGIRYHAAVPLWIGDRTIGIMNLAGPDDGMFDDADLEVLYGVGKQVAVALERARLHGHLEQLVEERTAALRAEVVERERAEAALREAEQRYRGLFENAVAGIFRTTLDGRVVMANLTLARLYGYASAAEMMAAIEDMSRCYVQPGRREEFIRLIGEHGTVHGFESQVYRRDGSAIWISEEARAVRDAGHQLVGFEGTVVDITARKQAEEARERLVAILEATPDLVGLADPEGKAVFLNRGGRELLGVPLAEDITGFPIAEAHPPAARDRLLREAIPAALQNGAWAGESVMVTRDGLEIPVRQVLLAHRAPDGRTQFLSTIAHDLRRQQALETQLRQSQKMEAVGRLAGGVAHDFNNLLTVVLISAGNLLETLATGAPGREDAEAVRGAALHGSDLTRQLLAFGRRQVLAPRVISINTIVADAERLLRRLIGDDIEVRTVLAPDLGAVRVDPNQLQQVIVNLAVNARDAMPEGGKLTIETANVELDDAYAATHMTAKAGPHVMLAVSDTGVGMDAHTQVHLFEPFFTTKEEGKGTGLGLATVFGIVKQSEGNIWVYSELGRGTTFKVYLPLVTETVEMVQQTRAATVRREGTETILLVEDNEAVRQGTMRVLRHFGYTVLEAGSGAEAVDVARKHAGVIQLLLCDVVMPGIPGREAARQLTLMRPGVRTLFLSGYTRGAITDRDALAPDMAFLQKPFTAEALAEKVREVLDARG